MVNLDRTCCRLILFQGLMWWHTVWEWWERKRLINIIREMVSVNICAIVEVPSHTYTESENDFFFFVSMVRNQEMKVPSLVVKRVTGVQRRVCQTVVCGSARR